MYFSSFEKNQQVIITRNRSGQNRLREMSRKNSLGGKGNRKEEYFD